MYRYIYIYPIVLFPFSQFYLYVWFVDAHSHPMNPPFQAITEEHLGRPQLSVSAEEWPLDLTNKGWDLSNKNRI